LEALAFELDVIDEHEQSGPLHLVEVPQPGEEIRLVCRYDHGPPPSRREKSCFGLSLLTKTLPSMENL